MALLKRKRNGFPKPLDEAISWSRPKLNAIIKGRAHAHEAKGWTNVEATVNAAKRNPANEMVVGQLLEWDEANAYWKELVNEDATGKSIGILIDDRITTMIEMYPSGIIPMMTVLTGDKAFATILDGHGLYFDGVENQFMEEVVNILGANGITIPRVPQGDPTPVTPPTLNAFYFENDAYASFPSTQSLVGDFEVEWIQYSSAWVGNINNPIVLLGSTQGSEAISYGIDSFTVEYSSTDWSGYPSCVLSPKRYKVVRVGSEVSFYSDDVLLDTRTYPDNSSIPFNYLGCDDSLSGKPFGYLWDVRIKDSTGKDWYFPMNEGSGSTFVEANGSGMDLTITNGGLSKWVVISQANTERYYGWFRNNTTDNLTASIPIPNTDDWELSMSGSTVSGFAIQNNPPNTAIYISSSDRVHYTECYTASSGTLTQFTDKTVVMNESHDLSLKNTGGTLSFSADGNVLVTAPNTESGLEFSGKPSSGMRIHDLTLTTPTHTYLWSFREGAGSIVKDQNGSGNDFNVDPTCWFTHFWHN